MRIGVVRAIRVLVNRRGEDLRITLNKRLATAAAAMVHRMISRRRPLVFRPVSPFKKGSKTSTGIFDVAGLFLYSITGREQIMLLRLNF